MSPPAFQTLNRICAGTGENQPPVAPAVARRGTAILALWAILVGCGQPSWAGGIHAVLAWSPRGVRVVDVPLDGPAKVAGLEDDDQLLEIDGVPVAGKKLDEVRRLLSGEVGSFVTLLVERRGKRLELRVERVPYSKGHS
jgi:S1-C subfamily serine protease